MRKISNKNKIVAIALVLLMASVVFTLYTPVQAQDDEVPVSGPLPSGVTPNVTITTEAHLSFRPNPVGVGQTFLVNLWTSPALHRSRYHPDYKVTITDPDGNEDVITLDSYHADATAWFEYVADQVGEWTLKFDFAGTYFPGGMVPGGFFEPPQVQLDSAYYRPSSSPELTLTVQEEMVYSWPPSPLPTDYWTRPAQVEHREWWTILGNWPATGYAGLADPTWDEVYPDTNPRWNAEQKFTPWVQGPNSAHIVWKRQEDIAGLLGGQAGHGSGLTAGPPTPDIIFAGRAYDSYSKPGTGGEEYWRCYDVRTGEVYWEYQTPLVEVPFWWWTTLQPLSPDLIEYASPTQSEVAGAEAAGGWSANLMTITGGRLYKFDPWTGEITTNVTIEPLSSGTFYQNSYARDEDPLVLTVQNLGGGNYSLIKWTTRGGSSNFNSRIISNTSYARSSLPSYIDWNAGLGASVDPVSEVGVWTKTRLRGYNLWTGQLLWDKTIDEPMFSPICSLVDHGKVATLSGRGYYVAYDIATGNQAWKSEKMNYPWASAGFGAYSAMSAYGMLFRESMDGVYAFNWTNGEIVWKFEAKARSPYESPYTTADNKGTVYPFYSFGQGGIIADGKFFTWNYEHTESWPVTRGWSLHAIDVFTGEAEWSMLGCIRPGAIADGYLVGSSRYDGYTYAFGKGKSATTVEAPLTAISLGQSVVLRGTVLDLSPAQPGTPCVSKESMATQMEYLHMQMPIAGLWSNETITGVPVSLDAVDPNGNFIHIGDVTTDGYSG
ncbi:MAG: PQQ-binding-like beta-propeller repeat protein, partial [Candidatus Bathyarchaeota archaeon]|nr:PQQ-binding-like beta-propeller repeat protein [Candidatus Bathyarchaeota archaeon]